MEQHLKRKNSRRRSLKYLEPVINSVVSLHSQLTPTAVSLSFCAVSRIIVINCQLIIINFPSYHGIKLSVVLRMLLRLKNELNHFQRILFAL